MRIPIRQVKLRINHLFFEMIDNCLFIIWIHAFKIWIKFLSFSEFQIVGVKADGIWNRGSDWNGIIIESCFVQNHVGEVLWSLDENCWRIEVRSTRSQWDFLPFWFLNGDWRFRIIKSKASTTVDFMINISNSKDLHPLLARLYSCVINLKFKLSCWLSISTNRKFHMLYNFLKTVAFRIIKQKINFSIENLESTFTIMSGFLIYDKNKNKIFHVKRTQISITKSTRSLFETTLMSCWRKISHLDH